MNLDIDVPLNYYFTCDLCLQLTIGSGNYRFTVGYVKYYYEWIDEPLNFYGLAAGIPGKKMK